VSLSLSLSGTCLELPAIESGNFLNSSNSFSNRQRGWKEGGGVELETDKQTRVVP